MKKKDFMYMGLAFIGFILFIFSLPWIFGLLDISIEAAYKMTCEKTNGHVEWMKYDLPYARTVSDCVH